MQAPISALPVSPQQPLLPGDATETWRPLRVLNLYRLVVAGFLTIVSAVGFSDMLFSVRMPNLFHLLSLIYLCLALIHIFTITNQRPGFAFQVYLQVYLDLAILMVFLYSTHGISSGLGALMVVSIAGGSLLMRGRAPYVVSAIGAIVALGVQTHLVVDGFAQIATLTQSGMLGAAFFGTALLAKTLAGLAREQTRLANQRGLDLENMAELNNHIIDHMQSGVIVVDPHWKIHAINARARSMLNTNPKRGTLLAQISPELSLIIRQWSESGMPAATTLRLGGSSEELLPRVVSLEDRARGPWLVFLEDAALMCQQAQESRLASLGRLTASIAHEIRNPLSSIQHASQLLEESEQLGGQNRRLCEIIGNNASRVDEIVENALQLSRKARTELERIRLDEWIRHFISEHTAADDPTFPIDNDAGDPVVLIDEGQLNQIMANLVSNAYRHGGGIARIVIGQRKEQITIDVINKGSGVPKETLGQIFDPFFTTHSQGTGLGLFIASQLANSHRGHISYHEHRYGPSFRLTLAHAEPAPLEFESAIKVEPSA